MSQPSVSSQQLPVVVIGAGPVGLAAAAHLAASDAPFVVLERGPGPGAAVAGWGHVRVFSPWRFNVDRVARRLLRATGWTMPPHDEFPTGRELIDRYLAPLAAVPGLASSIRYDAQVVAISRDGLDKMKTPGRDNRPFAVEVVDASGANHLLRARAVIDASGTWYDPNPLGSNGATASGEREVADVIRHGVPDVLGADRDEYANKRVLVVGSGHSAFNVLQDLVTLRASVPQTRVTWAIRGSATGQLFGGEANDALPERGALGQRIRALTRDGAITLIADAAIEHLQRTPTGVLVESSAGQLPEVDRIIAATGFRPDLGILRELRVDLDPAVECPRAIASLIDPNIHSCGTVPPHGVHELAQPERDFFIVGMKSYGRAPTFLMLTGYEQVRSVVAALMGDMASADRVRLTLPATGVCSSAPSDTATTGCCAPDLPVSRDRVPLTLTPR